MRALRAVLPVLALLVFSGHVGDNNTYFVGEAGPWDVQVVVRHPGVVPGLADITVRVADGTPSSVTVRLVQTSLGLEGAPRPDVAEPVPGQPGLYAAQLWFMTLGAYVVYVEIDGDRGAGAASVPVASTATRTLPMGASLGAVLAGLGLFLAVGLLTIVRAAVGESTVPPGEAIPARRRRRGWAAVGVAAVLLALVVTGGRAWWNAEASAYRGILFVPLDLHVTAEVDQGINVLGIQLADRNWLNQTWSPLVPDHGKLMHGFLVKEDQSAFAHVHPEPLGSGRFRLVAPPLPAGRYTFYGDIVHESGFAQTLVTELEMGAPSACTARAVDPTDPTAPAVLRICPEPDRDDSYWTGDVAEGADYVFDDGVRIRWENLGAFRAGEEQLLRFSVRGADDAPLAVQPYMGMAAHAAVQRDDRGVFVHLHPTGSVSTAAQSAAATRAGLDAGGAPHRMAMGAPDGNVSLLYAFPEPGTYRLWLQVMTPGGVRTAAWTVPVGP